MVVNCIERGKKSKQRILTALQAAFEVLPVADCNRSNVGVSSTVCSSSSGELFVVSELSIIIDGKSFANKISNPR